MTIKSLRLVFLKDFQNLPVFSSLQCVLVWITTPVVTNGLKYMNVKGILQELSQQCVKNHAMYAKVNAYYIYLVFCSQMCLVWIVIIILQSSVVKNHNVPFKIPNHSKCQWSLSQYCKNSRSHHGKKKLTGLSCGFISNIISFSTFKWTLHRKHDLDLITRVCGSGK